MKKFGSVLVYLALLFFVTSCTAPDTRHRVIVSVPEQKMVLLEDGKPVATFPVSTSKFALSDLPGSRGTPLGEMEIAEKVGAGAPPGAVFKDRRRTGEVVAPDAPGRDPIVTRILWLRGLEAQNRNAFSRDIYIHGTPEERNIGQPASYGCVRMTSRDIIRLYDIVGEGARVSIVDAPLAAVVPTTSPEAVPSAGSASTSAAPEAGASANSANAPAAR
jgi:lipoprotein-anchoring transpeptidase ErfK/SrfK